MDLLAKVGVLIVVLIIIFSAGFLLFVHPSRSQLTQAQAEQTVLTDIKTLNPNATVSIVAASASKQYNGSWDIVLSVVYNATRPCPSLSIQEYDYPALGLSGTPVTDNQYSGVSGGHCVIYGLSSAPTYVISSPEIAIARSYNASPPELVAFVNMYGYNDINAYASFFANMSPSTTPLNATFSNVWLVNYTSPLSPTREYVILGQSGQILGNYTETSV